MLLLKTFYFVLHLLICFSYLLIFNFQFIYFQIIIGIIYLFSNMFIFCTYMQSCVLHNCTVHSQIPFVKEMKKSSCLRKLLVFGLQA